MSSKKLEKSRFCGQYAIDHKMTPGIQLLIARKGKVIYNKNFGNHTYDGDEKVTSNDIYDVASLTKILGNLAIAHGIGRKRYYFFRQQIVRIIARI